MPWSKHVNSYPTEWIGIVQGIHELKLPIKVTFSTAQEAVSEKLRWHGFISAVIKSKHFLTPLVKELKIAHQKHDLTITITLNELYKSPPSVYTAALDVLQRQLSKPVAAKEEPENDPFNISPKD